MANINFSEINGFDNYSVDAQNVLKNTLKSFFSTEVFVFYEPFNSINNIQQYLGRLANVIDSNCILLLPYIKDQDDNRYYLGIKLVGKRIGDRDNYRIFWYIAKAIAQLLYNAYTNTFKNAVMLLDEMLIETTISNYLSRCSYSPYKINYLISKFKLIRSTTFEGKYFSSGLIVTKSLPEYKKEKNKNRAGSVIDLYSEINIYDPINTREWYLSDGHSSYFLYDFTDKIKNLFVYVDDDPNLINRMNLAKAVIGKDFLLRVDGGRDLSIISNSIEFIHQENIWRYRDYAWVKSIIMIEIGINEDVFYAVLYYIIYCSKHDISSILWIPKNIEKIDTLASTRHTFSRSQIRITDKSNESIIKRLLSSDGATVISKEGLIKYYGCIAKLEVKNSKGPSGTGEKAAGLLAKNGVVFKISQDGGIKLFLNNRDLPIRM